MGQLGDLAWPLRRAVRHHATAEALVDGDLRIDYSTLAATAFALGPGLGALGHRPGEVVAVLSANRAEYVACWLGLPAAGYVINPLNFRLAPDELVFICNDSGATVLLVDERFADVAVALRARCGALRTVVTIGAGEVDGAIGWSELVDHGAQEPSGSLPPETLAAISYTGGTTGLPKGVMQSHANLMANAYHVLIALPLGAHDRFLHASPMFHAAGASNVFALTMQGGTHVVLQQFDPDRFTALVEAERTTSTVIVPTMLNAIVHHPATAGRDLSSWRTFGLGAAPPPVELLRRATEVLPCDIRQIYGATETSPHLTSTQPGDIARWLADGDPRIASCGIPDIGVEVEVRDLETARRCPVGGIGEVVARGPNVMTGYWNRPAETADAFTADGWYRTGDLGRFDAEGYLYLVDRAKDMIITGGENVYTVEVENALYAHPDVLEATVFGIPHEVWGEQVHAEVVPRPGAELTVEALVAHCRSRIAGYKVPRSVNLRSEPLPKSGANKILKRELRAAYWS